MRQIEIDFDVFKELTAKLENESDNYNGVLRRLLKLTAPAPAKSPPAKQTGKPWVSKGVSFDHETEFRTNYKGQMYTARVNDGRLMISDHGASSSLSHAARLVTNTSVDGWTFWEVKRPTDSRWRKAGELRKS
jgi:negative regulator of replication initiation